MSVLTKLLKKAQSPQPGRRHRALLEDIGSREEALRNLSQEALRAKTGEFKKRLADGGPLNDLLPEAYAVVREAARRTLGERHYDVQILGGVVLHNRAIAEMKTGEGKTLVATLPAYVNALSGKGVHIITVNDYLSRRDCVWMGQVYEYLGLSVAVVNHNASFIYDSRAASGRDTERDEKGAYHIMDEFLRPCSRREAYEADITYGTNSEFGFDYLRDNIAYAPERVVQRGFHYVIVDEIDSILIDEARTPLIISAPVGEKESLYPRFTKIAAVLREGEDYTKDEKLRAVQLTDAGIEKTEKELDVGNIYTDAGVKYVHHLETAVRAEALFLRDRDYVVRDGEVVIVDQFTGRLQPGRRWSEGLHQAIEAKEGVQIKEESRTFASITYQNYFRMYEKLSGMTGTALTSAEEFAKVYGLETLEIPTHRPSARMDHPDLIFQTEKGKFTAIARRVRELNEKGQPVLIGTVSVEKNEQLSQHLAREGVRYEILNAKNHEREAEIVANAGRKGSVVLATNMAGRGVDIKLGGAEATKEEYEEVKSLGGLFVLGTERHEARRIDNQLRGRAGRQGDPGETQFFVSLEDTLMRVFGGERVKNMMGRFGVPEDEPVSTRMVSRAIENAQTKIEGFNFDARKHVLEYDNVLNQQRQSVYTRRRGILFGERGTLEEFLGEVTRHADNPDEAQKTVESKKQELGEDTFWDVFRQVALQSMDLLWVEHLEVMDYMRRSVNLRAYGQRDPLVEYKKEGLRLFKELEQSIVHHVMTVLPHARPAMPAREEIQVKEVHENARMIGGSGKAQKGGHKAARKVGRNDLCPCGSGRKYKRCHGR